MKFKISFFSESIPTKSQFFKSPIVRETFKGFLAVAKCPVNTLLLPFPRNQKQQFISKAYMLHG